MPVKTSGRLTRLSLSFPASIFAVITAYAEKCKGVKEWVNFLAVLNRMTVAESSNKKSLGGVLQMMTETKTISVPIRHYQLLAVLAQQYLEYLTDKPKQERTLDEQIRFAALVRWEQWNAAADERGLTR